MQCHSFNIYITADIVLTNAFRSINFTVKSVA